MPPKVIITEEPLTYPMKNEEEDLEVEEDKEWAAEEEAWRARFIERIKKLEATIAKLEDMERTAISVMLNNQVVKQN